MIEQTLDITTRAGAMETFVCRPERGGPFPPVVMLMDAPGIREELRDMARRLATVGYCVLLPNLYYRAGRDTIYGPTCSTKAAPSASACARCAPK
jgi:carboxymethylenebutenolidase